MLDKWAVIQLLFHLVVLVIQKWGQAHMQGIERGVHLGKK